MVSGKHLPQAARDKLRRVMFQVRLTNTAAAREMHITRGHLAQMLSGRLPMSFVYGLALQAVLRRHLENQPRAGGQCDSESQPA